MPLWKKTDTANGAPTYLSETDKDKVYLVDTAEASASTNKAKGLNTAGWNLYSTYTDSDSNTRHRAECLVAMSVSNTVAGDTGAIVINVTSMVNGVEYTIVTSGNTTFSSLGAANSDVGVTFTANTTNISNTDVIGTTEGTVRPTEDDTVADA